MKKTLETISELWKLTKLEIWNQKSHINLLMISTKDLIDMESMLNQVQYQMLLYLKIWELHFNKLLLMMFSYKTKLDFKVKKYLSYNNFHRELKIKAIKWRKQNTSNFEKRKSKENDWIEQLISYGRNLSLEIQSLNRDRITRKNHLSKEESRY